MGVHIDIFDEMLKDREDRKYEASASRWKTKHRSAGSNINLVCELFMNSNMKYYVLTSVLINFFIFVVLVVTATPILLVQNPVLTTFLWVILRVTGHGLGRSEAPIPDGYRLVLEFLVGASGALPR